VRKLFAICWSVLLVAIATASPALAASSEQLVEAITVEGNQRIETATIESYLEIKPGHKYTRYDLDKSMKLLYDTGFFSDISMNISSNVLTVQVTENPSVVTLAFEGNKALNDDDLTKEVSLHSRSIYTRTAVQRDVKRLLDVYRRKGFYSANIEPRIIQREQNRIDLVYEVTEGPETTIQHITFIGNKSFPSSTLEQVINSENYRWYKFLSNNDKYDPDRLAYDQELLRRFYRSQGYADFQVKSAFAELTPNRDAFYLTFTIEEGPRYTFGKIEMESEIKEENKDAILKKINTKSGDRFDATEIENSIDSMVAELGDRGYAFVDIEPVLKRNTKEQIIDLTYNVKQGARIYIERINIIGNVSTLDEVIRREFRLAEGDAYSTSKLRRSEQRLKNLGYFEEVSVTNEEGSASDKTVITVKVQEKSTGEITLGAGVSSTDGPLADIGLTERNLLGRGQELKFRVLAAAERQQFDVGFTEPYTFGRDVASGFDLYKITQDLTGQSSFNRDAVGGKIRAGYNLGEKLRHNVYYAFEENQVSQVQSNASRFIKDQQGTNITSLIGHSFIYDDRDNRLTPTDGWYLRVNEDFAGLGGDDKFLRHELLGEYYIPVAPKWTMAFAGSTGHLLSVGEDIRINQRFFVGGRDLRGFNNGGIGPRDITTNDALGGNMYYTGSAELQFPLGLPEDLGFSGAFFVDAGSLWEVDDVGPEIADIDSLRASAGFGVAWASPFGPIRIDFAKPFLKEEFDDLEMIRFSFGTRF